MEVGLSVCDIVLDGDPAPPPQKKGTAPQFSAHVYCGQMAGWMKMPLGSWYGSRPWPRPHCVRWGPSSPLPAKGAQQTPFSAHVYCGHGRPSQLLLSSCLFVLQCSWRMFAFVVLD